MKKRVWIFNHYAMPPQYEVRVRNNKMAEIMQGMGYDVTIFGASTLHNTEINLIQGREKYIECYYGDLRFIHIRAPKYKGNGLARIMNMLVFPARLFFATISLNEKPDIIINDLELMGFFYPFLIGRRYRCPVITEIRDLWPESIIEFGYLRRRSFISSALFWCEKWIYSLSDAVVFTKEGEVNYIREQGWDMEAGGPIDMSKVHYINNGVDLAEFADNATRHPLDDRDLTDTETFKVVYVGSIRHANNIGRLLDAAKIVKDLGHEKVRFLIYGDGDEREHLERRVALESITNVRIKGHVNKKHIPFILRHSSLNVLNYMESGIWKRGNSSNKLFEYMASGRPILSTIRMNYCIIDKYGCGSSVEDSTSDSIARKVVEFFEMPPERYEEYGKNAARGARDFDWRILTDRLVEIIESL